MMNNNTILAESALEESALDEQVLVAPAVLAFTGDPWDMMTPDSSNPSEDGPSNEAKTHENEESGIIRGDPFTSEQEQIISDALTFSSNQAKVAAEAVRNPNEEQLRIFLDLFGKSDPGVIRKNFRLISEAKPPPIHMYGGGGNEKLKSGMEDGTTYAYTAFGEAIFLSKTFWGLEPHEQRYCIFHELSHWVNPNILDYSKFGVKNGLAEEYDFLLCSLNAYSYQYFAEKIGQAPATPNTTSTTAT